MTTEAAYTEGLYTEARGTETYTDGPAFTEGFTIIATESNTGGFTISPFTDEVFTDTATQAYYYCKKIEDSTETFTDAQVFTDGFTMEPFTDSFTDGVTDVTDVITVTEGYFCKHS